jgi:hypothetical protein
MRNRPRVSIPLAVTLGLVASLTIAGIVQAAETTLTATLAGDADTDDDGSGTATVVLDPAEGTACWEFSVEDVDPITVSHIHEGAEGVDGGVVVDLDLDGFEATSEGCNEAADADTLQAVIDDPAGFYVNVHNAAFPGGAIRGQLAAGTVPSTALPMSDGSPVLIGVLVLALAAAIGLRAWRPISTRD